MRRPPALLALLLGAALLVVCSSDDEGAPSDDSAPAESEAASPTTEPEEEDEEACALLEARGDELFVPGPVDVGNLAAELDEEAAWAAQLVEVAPPALAADAQALVDAVAAMQAALDDPGAGLEAATAADSASALIAAYGELECGLDAPVVADPDAIGGADDLGEPAVVEDGVTSGPMDPDDLRAGIEAIDEDGADEVLQLEVAQSAGGIDLYVILDEDVTRASGLAACELVGEHVFEVVGESQARLWIESLDPTFSFVRYGASESCEDAVTPG